MEPIPENVRKLLEKMSDQIGMLTGMVTELDAARMAHRHLLGQLLAHKTDAELAAISEDLISVTDAMETQAGPRRAAAYREEVDSVIEEARSARS